MWESLGRRIASEAADSNMDSHLIFMWHPLLHLPMSHTAVVEEKMPGASQYFDVTICEKKESCFFLVNFVCYLLIEFSIFSKWRSDVFSVGFE